MDFSRLEFLASELDAVAFQNCLERYHCLLIRGLAGPALMHALLQRSLAVFSLRQQQFEQHCLPAGYAKNYEYGAMTYIGVRELDLPQEPPYQVVRLFAASVLRPLLASYLGTPLYFNPAESAVRRQMPERPEIYVPFHQDGPFCMQPAWPQINCWVPLVACGELAPALEMLPASLGEMLPVAPAAHPLYAHYALAESDVLRHGKGLWHPAFEPGDVLVLSPYALHRTYALPQMHRPRYSLELRFAAGGIPADLRQTYGLIQV